MKTDVALLVQTPGGLRYIPAEMTTEHAASSYGLPVAVIDGQEGAGGPDDVLVDPETGEDAPLIAVVPLLGADQADIERIEAGGWPLLAAAALG